jgi:hypothetical protein
MVGQPADCGSRMERNNAPEDGATNVAEIEQQSGSVSFVVTSYKEFERTATVLEILRPVVRAGDEVIVLTGSAPVRAESVKPWFRVVTLPNASEFALRAHIPAVCRKEWVVLLEDHALVDSRTIDIIRDLIRNRPQADMVVFLAKNLTATSRWAWAVFLHTFALVWAPVDRPPPFSPVTSAVVRRAKLGSEAAIEEGAWELQVIPRIFADGKVEYSNDIFIDHVKPMSLVPAVLISFHNARAGAALQRKFRIPTRNILYEGWYCFAPRPRLLADALAHRAHELPAGSFWRLHVLGFGHLIGNFVGSFFGGGRSALKL